MNELDERLRGILTFLHARPELLQKKENCEMLADFVVILREMVEEANTHELRAGLVELGEHFTPDDQNET